MQNGKAIFSAISKTAGNFLIGSSRKAPEDFVLFFFKKLVSARQWWRMPLIPALESQRQADF